MKTILSTSKKGIDLIKEFESLSLKKYKDPVGYWTIGWGHLIKSYEKLEVITEDEAEDLLMQDLVEVEVAVNSLVYAPLNQNQFDALVSFTFNLGYGALKASTLLSKLNGLDYDGAANEFPKWIYGKGQILPGLVRRRKEEKKLFIEEVE